MKKLRDDATTPALKRLMHDHRRIRKLLRRAGRAKGQSEDLAADLEAACAALAAHDDIEERWLYPALREVPAARAATVDAEVAHDLVRQLVASLQAMESGDERLGATVRLLRLLHDQHVEDEEAKLFDHARERALDLAAIEEAFAARPDAAATGTADLDDDAPPTRLPRAPDSAAEQRQRARGPGRRGAH